MTLVRNAKQFAAAVAAFAGLSLTVAYAAPNYAPPALSPVDTTTLNSSAPLLNNFNQYLGSIQAKLTGKSLALPADPANLLLDSEFYAAVAAAVDADEDHAEQIVSAAVQYKPAKVKDIVKAVVLGTPSKAPQAVAGAAHAAPTRGVDAATGALLALVATAGSTPAELANAADDAVIAETRELIEKVAKAAMAATKGMLGKGTDSQVNSAVAVAEALIVAYSTDVSAASSTAHLYADDVARGIIGGVNGFAETDKAEIAGKILTKLGAGANTSAAQAVNFAMGALKASNLITGANGYDDVAAALATSATALAGSVNPQLDKFNDLVAEIAAGAKAQKDLRSAAPGTTVDGYKAIFQASLGATEAANADAFVSGAMQVLKSRAGDITKWAFEDAEAASLTVAARQAVVAAAVTGNFGQTSKVVAASMSALANPLSASDAVTAAIPASTNLYSGAAVSAALKLVPVTNATDSTAVLQAAINAAAAANYANAIGDIVLSSVKSKKIHDNELITTAINSVPAGWEEAVAAIVIANNSKDKPDSITGKTNETAAQDAASAKGGPTLLSSVSLAITVARNGKASPKTLFDDAIEAAYANPTLPRAILFGAGAVNNKLTPALLGMLLNLKTGGDSAAALHDYAVSLNKKGKLGIDLAYQAAVDALAYEDNLFDMVDHKILTNPKQAVEILSAVVAARPEYAHFAARAAAFRAPAAVGKTALAAIQFAHMRSNRTSSGSTATAIDDPAAVAAISAATVLGVKDAKLSTTKELAAIKAAIAGLVKGSLSFQNLNPLDAAYKKDGLIGPAFEEANGTGDSVDDVGATSAKRSKGTAAVLTGAVAQLQVNDPTTVPNELATLNPLAAAAITAATKAVKTHALAFAQAAGAAAAAAASAGGTTFTDFLGIYNAINAVLAGSLTQTAVTNAAKLGADQYFHGIYGPGAAGILNYSQVSGNGSFISDISNF